MREQQLKRPEGIEFAPHSYLPRARVRRLFARVLTVALTASAAVAPVAVLLAPPASAATGGTYLQQATDPHGNIWLAGTTDGTTTGPMDPGTDPASAGYGHLWTTDVPSGFCRIIPSSTDPATGAVKAAAIDRSTAGGCITAGGKAGGPALDPRRNADGTFYLYTPDWAVRSSGVYRLTYNPGTQTMTKSELLAPNRFPFDNKPFDVQLGPLDNKLYVSNDKDGNLVRITGVNGPVGLQQVQSVGHSSDASRMRALTFACWSNLGSLNGGAGASRAPGAPGCSAADPAPDLVLAQKTSITVILNAETCQTAPGGCTAVKTPIKVLTPMGLRTDPADPSVIYVSDSPGAISQIIRYHVGTDIQDSYANYGVMPDGSLSQFSFAFDVGFGPDHSMYVGDDPTAGATAFNGRYFRVGPNTPADAQGAPGVPANIPPLPTPYNGTLYGGAFGTDVAPAGYSDPTLPGNSVWLPGSLGGHLWSSDSLNGLCRMDVPPARALTHENLSTCMVGATAGGLLKPEQSSYDAGRHLLYVADGGTKSVGVVRFSFDPLTETLSNPQVIASGLVGTGLGLDGQRADAVARDPLTDALYVGFRTRKVGATTQIARVNNASAVDTTAQGVDFLANTTRDVPVFGLGVVVNSAVGTNPATADLYVGDNKGVDALYNVGACVPGGCSPILLLNTRGPKGFATDGIDHLWMSSPPPPGTASSTTTVQKYTISTGILAPFTAVGVNPDATQQPYAYAFGLTLDPAGNVYVSDNPNVLAPPNNAAHVWKVNIGAAGPAQPALISKPGSPTNISSPTFAFQSVSAGVSYQCSMVPTTTPATAEVFTACTSGQASGPLADGPWTFKVRAVDATGTVSPAAAYGFTVDTVVPVVTIGTSPANPTKVNTPSFAFTSSKASTTFKCSLSTGVAVYSTCGSPQSYAAQADGTYTFSVQGSDLAGNVSAPANVTVAIDTVAPVVTAAPAGGSYPSAQPVTLNADEPAIIYYSADGSVPTTASTVYTGPIPVAASTTLNYIAVDTAGNTSAVATQNYTIGPVIIGSSPASPSADTSSSFAFSTPGVLGATFACAKTIGPPTAADFTACTSPVSYLATPAGTWTFTVNAKDAGGAAIGSATRTFLLDATAPVLTGNPANPSSTSNETFAFHKAQSTGWIFQCSLVASGTPDAFGACTSPTTFPGAVDGTYTFKVRALDAASAPSSTTAYSFSVNAGAVAPTTTAPTATLTVPSGPASLTSIPVGLNWTGSANATGYELQQSINGGAFFDVAGCTATTPCTGTSAAVTVRPSATNQSTVTSYRYQVRASNASGVFGAYAAAAAFSAPAIDNSGGFSFNGGWSGVNAATAYNGSLQQSSTANAFAQNSTGLSGSTVAWVSTMGPDRGMASVSVDGGPAQTVDLYSATPKPATIVWQATTLGVNPHTIKVTVLSTRNAAATGNKVDIDAYLALK
jgi:hypothetical protein